MITRAARRLLTARHVDNIHLPYPPITKHRIPTYFSTVPQHFATKYTSDHHTTITKNICFRYTYFSTETNSNANKTTKPISSTSSTSTTPPQKITIKRRPLSKDTGHVSQPSTSEKMMSTLRGIRDFISLYWQSVKSFAREIKLGIRLSYRIYLKGHRYTRSERKKMQRAALDVMKVLPFVSMTLVVGTEITALLAARAIPNMLPRAFQPVAKRVDENLPKFVDKVLPSGKEQDMARNKTNVEIADKLHELSLEYVTHLQESDLNTTDLENQENRNTVTENGTTTIDIATDSKMIAEFLAKTDDHEARLTQSDIAAVGPAFRRHMQLQQLGNAPRGREVLVRLSQYLNVNSGSELLNLLLPTFFLIRRLRMKVQSTRADDKDIHFEGVASLSEEELVDACYERGLARKVEDTLNALTLRSRLRDWISLSINRDVPSSLLILSSALISRSQLKLEQEHGANALQIATLEHRIQELNSKIGRRIDQRNEAKRVLKQLVDRGGLSNVTNATIDEATNNFEKQFDATNIDIETTEMKDIKEVQELTEENDLDAIQKLHEMEKLNEIYNRNGTLQEALAANGIHLDKDKTYQSLISIEASLRPRRMDFVEFQTHFVELKRRANDLRLLQQRAEALNKMEGLLFENEK